MIVYLGADHRGYALKERIKKALAEGPHDVRDLGAASLVSDDDYPDYAAPVAEAVLRDPQHSRGIVICGSGAGVEIVANRFKGVRATLALSAEHIAQVRHDDDMNVLALAADFTSESDALAIVDAFLKTSFDASVVRYVRRLRKIDAIERGA
jgi:ribose 5-phosphate isomerase B